MRRKTTMVIVIAAILGGLGVVKVLAAATCGATSTTTHADKYGGTAEGFTLEGGATVGEVRTPPQGFDVAMASDEELRWYGIDPRPSDPTEAANWSADWQGATWSSGVPCFQHAQGKARNTRNDPRWAGQVATADTYTTAVGHFTYPSGQNNCFWINGTYSRHSIWVGLGGGQGLQGRLLQNGAEGNGQLSGDPENPSVPTWFWAAYYPGVIYDELDYDPTKDPTKYPFTPGDNVAISTTYDPTGSDSGGPLVTFGYHNITRGPAWSASFATIASHRVDYYYDGGSGEAVDERSCCVYALTDFAGHPVVWTDVRVYSAAHSSGIAIRSAPHDGYIMTEQANALVLASPAAVPGNDTPYNFQDEWHNCGDGRL